MQSAGAQIHRRKIEDIKPLQRGQWTSLESTPQVPISLAISSQFPGQQSSTGRCNTKVVIPLMPIAFYLLHFCGAQVPQVSISSWTNKPTVNSCFHS